LGNIPLPSISFDRQKAKTKRSSDSDLAKREPTGIIKGWPIENQPIKPTILADGINLQRRPRSAFTYRRFSTSPPLDETSMVNAGHNGLRGSRLCRECGRG
jgi:hypothetical protein